MGKCYDNPKYDRQSSSVQNTWEHEHQYNIEESKQKAIKNLHVLHSTKPSKLGFIYESNSYHIFTNGENPHDICDNLAVYKNIYITSEENIKEGDWCLGVTNELMQITQKSLDIVKPLLVKPCWKKIIQTTDQKLTDGNVQPISGEFLQWFIKNSNCEFVEIERLENGRYINFLPNGDTEEGVYENYKIIIPKEEWISPMQKFKLREEIYTEVQQNSLEFNKSLIKSITTEELDLLMSKFDDIEPKQREMFLMNANTVIDTRKPKEEILEEAVEKYLKDVNTKVHKDIESGVVVIQKKDKKKSTAEYIDNHLVQALVEVAKEGKMYSEEEVQKIASKAFLIKSNNETIVEDFNKWWNKIKKR